MDVLVFGLFLIISSSFTFLYIYDLGFDKLVYTATPSEYRNDS